MEEKEKKHITYRQKEQKDRLTQTLQVSIKSPEELTGFETQLKQLAEKNDEILFLHISKDVAPIAAVDAILACKEAKNFKKVRVSFDPEMPIKNMLAIARNWPQGWWNGTLVLGGESLTGSEIAEIIMSLPSGKANFLGPHRSNFALDDSTADDYDKVTQILSYIGKNDNPYFDRSNMATDLFKCAFHHVQITDEGFKCVREDFPDQPLSSEAFDQIPHPLLTNAVLNPGNPFKLEYDEETPLPSSQEPFDKEMKYSSASGKSSGSSSSSSSSSSSYSQSALLGTPGIGAFSQSSSSSSNMTGSSPPSQNVNSASSPSRTSTDSTSESTDVRSFTH